MPTHFILLDLITWILSTNHVVINLVDYYSTICIRKIQGNLTETLYSESSINKIVSAMNSFTLTVLPAIQSLWIHNYALLLMAVPADNSSTILPLTSRGAFTFLMGWFIFFWLLHICVPSAEARGTRIQSHVQMY
jgi:hypothetical protein